MITKTVTVHDAQTQFSELLKFALKGNEIIIIENDKKLARLVPILSHKKPCVAGLNRGKIWASEDFDTPLPDEFWTSSKGNRNERKTEEWQKD